MRKSTLLALLLLLFASIATAREVVERPYTGVTITRRVLSEPRPLRMFVVEVDLTAPGVSVETSPGNGQAPGAVTARRVSTVARDEGYAVCVNAGVFRPMVMIEGSTVTVDGPGVHAGSAFAPARDRRHALCVGQDGRASIRLPPLDDVFEAVAGFDAPPCLESGMVGGPEGGLQPRTAAGVSRDGSRLILLVVDGRQPGESEGATLHEVAGWLRAAGAWNGINLDGGGSTTLVTTTDGTPRVVNVPVGLKLPGTERPVATCIGIRARPEPEASVTTPSGNDVGESAGGPGTVTLALLVASGALLVAVLLLRRRRTAAAPAEEEASLPPRETPAIRQRPFLAIGVLAVAALAVVVAAILEGGDPPGEPSGEPAAGAGAPANAPLPPADVSPADVSPGDLTISRAARTLLRDAVEPIADLVNTAGGDGQPRFVDRLSRFTVLAQDRTLVIRGDFPRATVYRFDVTTRDGAFDMRRLYVPLGRVAYPDRASVHARRLAPFLGRDQAGRDRALTHTGPWDLVSGEWKVPTARVALDDAHVYTSWFDLPDLEDQAAGRVAASFALIVDTPGEHRVKIAFDDFVRHTRWRPTTRSTVRPPAKTIPNPLRVAQVASIAVGEDERVRDLEDVPLLPDLAGRHPRLPDAAVEEGPLLEPEDAEIEKLILTLDPDRGELWEYSDDAESMGSGNDMDAGTKGLLACQKFDRLAARMSPEARQAVDAAFRKRFEGMYRYFVFERNYNATGYAQNHASKAVWALLGAGLVGDGPEARTWRNWAVMMCRKRVELLGRDGGLEVQNEARDYGMRFWERSRELILHCTGRDLARGPFFENEWRFALHHSPGFPSDRIPAIVTDKGELREGNVPLPEEVSAESLSTAHHFDDCDVVTMREDWTDGALRVRLAAGSVFGKEGTARALRYNWAHCAVNRGSVSLWQGSHALLNEPGTTRTYRKSAGNNNCVLVNDTDQWGGGQVYHPRLGLEQMGAIAFFADGDLIDVTRADLAGAYPPEARVESLSRILVHLAPDQFLVFDRLETEGPGKGEWRFHAPFVDPLRPARRFTVFAAQRNRKSRKQRHLMLDEAYTRVAEVHAEVEFLWPPVKADVRMSDVAFRSGPLSLPVRHLRVVQEGASPHVLMTAFGRRRRLSPDGAGAFAGRAGSISWNVLVGPGSAGGLESDGHLTLLARDEATGRAEVFRFGGGRIRLDGKDLPEGGPDLLIRLRNGEVESTVPAR